MAKAKKPAPRKAKSASPAKDSPKKTTAAAKKAAPASATDGAKAAAAKRAPEVKPNAPKDAPDARPADQMTAKPTTSGIPKVEKPAPKPAEAKPEPEAVAEKAETAAEETAPVKPQPPDALLAQPVPKERSIFLPLVLGGVVAAGMGFAVSEFNLLNLRLDTSAVEARLNAQQDQIAALAAGQGDLEGVRAQIERIEALENATVPDLDLSGVEAQIAAVSESVQSLSERIEGLEARPVAIEGGSAELSEAQAAELAALTASVEAQKSEITRLLENAKSVEEATADAARAAAAQAALAKITSALGSGNGFQTAIDELAESQIGDVPQTLSSVAGEGVATLLSLQGDFPDVARAALAASRAAGATNDGEGISGFLRRQLGARSVSPREGSDPDAVLSRAEAAVRDGRLAEALGEIQALPPEAQAVMEGWLTKAQARAAAEAGVEVLNQRLSAN